ncbi:MAG: sulfatase-like hydrolase/transferase [Deltaproteobacteria bacterium]|nr:sulfatase-like hydrolase/transferase [Deltaproteobacteria bacterium]
MILITLDTTRSDSLGCYGGPTGNTPHLDALAARGTRFSRALTASPLTLPAHASLMTGLAPPEHGIHDNGTVSLDSSLPTLAARLRKSGFATGAFVASRVLDSRFGLDAGFDFYDDRMAAEISGEYGYPERDAAAVVTAASSWLSHLKGSQPIFLWVHFYDPHAPYGPPGKSTDGSSRAAYDAEVARVDAQIGRLLEEIPQRPGGWLVAAVADHGEALGEHGERTHGLLLQRSTLEVPLILAGPGVSEGEVITETVASRRLATTLLHLLGDRGGPLGTVPGLPGMAPQNLIENPQQSSVKGPPQKTAGKPTAKPAPNAEPRAASLVYSETYLPSTAYGWSPLKALSGERLRLVVGPKPELFDFVSDPGESKNLLHERRSDARYLKEALEAMEERFEYHEAPPTQPDPELAAALQSLGYASGSRGGAEGLAPKDGLPLLEEFSTAKVLMQRGAFREAAASLQDLNRRSPNNIPFLTQWARARLQAGDTEGGLATYQKAARLNPQLHFLHLNLADAYKSLGRLQEARQEYELALDLFPRAASAWLSLGELANRQGKPKEEEAILQRAVDAGTGSALILTRLAQLKMAEKNHAAAEAHLKEATELLPQWPTGWLVRGQNQLQGGHPELGRSHLQQALTLGANTPEGREARRLLATIPGPAPRE